MTTSTFTPTLPPMELAAATLVRPGDAATVERLIRQGARIVRRGTHRDIATGAIWPCIVARLGRARVVIVLCGECCERALHPPGGVWTVWRAA